MTVQERIKQFGEKNAPFYICDHENGKYSLCLPLDFLSGDYEDFGQEAFNRYAVEMGEPIEKNHCYTHGDGHEWGIVFTKAFENDSHMRQIELDCEMGGFFCCANDLTLLEDFGSRFRELCMDKEKFYELVKDALSGVEIKESKEDEEFIEKVVQAIKDKGLGIAGTVSDESMEMEMKM